MTNVQGKLLGFGAVAIAALLPSTASTQVPSSRPGQQAAAPATVQAYPGSPGVPAGDYNVSLRTAEDKSLPNMWARDETFFQVQDGPVLGGASGIRMDKDGKSIWVFQRCGTYDYCIGSNDPPLIKFDAKGKIVARLLGGQIVYPHGMTVDRDGNVWVTDLRTNTHEQGDQSAKRIPGAAPNGAVVRKYSPQGKLLLTLGTPGVYGNDDTHLSQPSAVVVARNGDIFVADGHDSAPSNNRIVRYDKNGKFIKAWGSTGSGPDQLNCPHDLAIDSLGRLIVADRGNNRIQIFNVEGKLLDSWTHWGRVSGLYVDSSDVLYAVDSMSGIGQENRFMRGAHIGDARTGKLTAFIPDPLGNPAPWNPLRGTSGMEGITAAGGEFFVSQVTPPGLAKYTPKPWKTKP